MVHVVSVLLVALAAAFAGVLLVGAHRWRLETQALRTRLDAARRPVQPPTVDLRDLDGLPAPVRRFFSTALTQGQPMVVGLHVSHSGTFNMGEAEDRWKPFTSEQKVVAQRPGFDWDGRVSVLPGLSVRVHDSYIAGEGILHASLLGLFSLANERGTDAMAEGELMRFLAEASWYPTALLPSQGVCWEPVDDRSAQATLTDGAISVTLRFSFNDAGLIDTVHAEARGRMVNGTMVPTPWQGRFWNYTDRDGMRVPNDGEVAWLLPTGPKPYWRGHVTTFDVERAR